MDFLAANHVRIVGLCGQNWNRTLCYSFSLRSLRPSNVVEYLTIARGVDHVTTVHGQRAWPAVGTGRWAQAVHRWQVTVYRLRHRCPTARTAASHTNSWRYDDLLSGCLMYCSKTVRPSEKLSEGVNRKPGSKSWFFGSAPYFYFRFRLYGHRDGRFCRTVGQTLL